MNRTEMLEQEIKELKRKMAAEQTEKRNVQRGLHHLKGLVTMHEGVLQEQIGIMSALSQEAVENRPPLELHVDWLNDLEGIHQELKIDMKDRGVPTQAEKDAASREYMHAAHGVDFNEIYR